MLEPTLGFRYRSIYTSAALEPSIRPESRGTYAETVADMAALAGLLQRDEAGALALCPLMLTPAPIEAVALTELEELTSIFGRLLHRVASDVEFLSETLAGAATTDDYTRFLLELAVHEQPGNRDWRFCVTRSDYFSTPDGRGLRQVELNTIAASYVGLASRIGGFHQTLATLTGAEWDVVANDPVTGVADAFAEVVAAYGAPDACVLLVAQPGERNIFDQRILEQALAERGVAVVRSELEALGERARLRNGELLVDGRVAAVTYFRAGYRPDELASEAAREVRRMLARSTSICVPDLPTHLSGTKKVQQVLAQPEVLARFLEPEDAARVASCFALMAGLDDPIEVDGRSVSAAEAAMARPEDFVLKPQREGGGFNLYGPAIVEAIEQMSPEQRQAYVLMERLRPPARPAMGLRQGRVWEGEVVSELGHFGVLFARGDEICRNRGVGYLVRTKLHDQDESGISGGQGHLDGLIRTSGG